jgi:hypothetical protein
MAKWDYLTVRIRYEGKKHKDWVLEIAERAPLVGMQEILAKHSADGWELVSLTPEDQEAYPAFGKYSIQTTVYRATFKRPSEY